VSNKFAAIPDIGNTVDSLRDACQAMKQMLETLTQQRGAVNKPAGAVTFADLISLGIISSNYGAKFLGKYNNLRDLADGTWTAYTPTVFAGSGTFTSASATGRYSIIGKTVFFEVAISITTNGTAATFVGINTPPNTVAVTSNIIGCGRDILGAGKMLQMFINGTTAGIVNYDNTYPGSSGAQISVSGTFETT
jgi:hypothetical protein